jgi:hypothetical protein
MWKIKTDVENGVNARVIKATLILLGVRRAAQRMDSRRFWLVCGGLMVLFATIGAPSSALAQSPPLVFYDGPFAMAIPGPCVSTDVISLTGRMVITFYGRPDGSGGQHITFRTVTKLQGTNQDLINPKKYVMNDENVTDTNIPSGGSYDQTQVINQGVIRQGETTGDNIFLGSGDDFMLKTTIHFTVNANGIPTAAVNDMRQACM